VTASGARCLAKNTRERLQVTKKRTAVETLGIYERLGEVQLEGPENFLAAFRAL
jgi:hypothetical protein